ncbi:MAG: YeeE/YedE family protein [Ignavibacteriaceae bacterium]|nr:YeeE/YedE family protein [Ignavibacteriaceae bacterium]
MNAPFYKFGLFNDEVSLIVAFAIGIGFGFFLERAGFGSARKLAAQFYFEDMAVVKVMFTAVVTAMLGLFYLNWIGFIDLSLVYKGNTYLLPQIAGGLILGIGFVVGGYCPGTSCVAVSTGRMDGIIYLLGVMAGIFFFGEVFPLLSGFFYSTNMGVITLPELSNLPYGMIVFFVVLMAIGTFAASGWAEKKFGNKKV